MSTRRTGQIPFHDLSFREDLRSSAELCISGQIGVFRVNLCLSEKICVFQGISVSFKADLCNSGKICVFFKADLYILYLPGQDRCLVYVICVVYRSCCRVRAWLVHVSG